MELVFKPIVSSVLSVTSSLFPKAPNAVRCIEPEIHRCTHSMRKSPRIRNQLLTIKLESKALGFPACFAARVAPSRPVKMLRGSPLVKVGGPWEGCCFPEKKGQTQLLGTVSHSSLNTDLQSPFWNHEVQAKGISEMAALMSPSC